jgi:hypothetical protein
VKVFVVVTVELEVWEFLVSISSALQVVVVVMVVMT